MGLGNSLLAGWGGRIRTCDPGTKTRCLATWLRPSIASRRRDYTGAYLNRQDWSTFYNHSSVDSRARRASGFFLEHFDSARHRLADDDESGFKFPCRGLGVFLRGEDAVDGGSGAAHGGTQSTSLQQLSFVRLHLRDEARGDWLEVVADGAGERREISCSQRRDDRFYGGGPLPRPLVVSLVDLTRIRAFKRFGQDHAMV